MQKQEGKKKKNKPFNDSLDVFDFEYKLKNALSLLESADILPEDKKKIREFIDLLKALRVSKGRIPKNVLHLKMIGQNLKVNFESATRKDIEHYASSWLYEQTCSAETTADYIMVL